MKPPPNQKVTLRKSLRRALAGGHPWVFRDALDRHRIPAGEVVTVVDRRGRFVARGIAESGPIGVRVFTTRDEPVDARLFARRVKAAVELRDRVVPERTSVFRVVHGEGDRLPGVVCDRYDKYAVVQFDGEGITHHTEAILGALEPELTQRGVKNLLLRSGRRQDREVLAMSGRMPAGVVEVEEHGMLLGVDLVNGQKTGLFLDHRESRRRVRELAAGLRVLNLYGYTGGFSVAAGLGGAEWVETVDIAPAAVELARTCWIMNALSADNHQVHAADVHEFLDGCISRKATYDLVIADPPSFAPRESSRKDALEAYRKLHQASLGLLEPGGLYLAASCSSHVPREDFEQSLREGAGKARRVLQVLERWGAPADHPRLLGFPEGDYLKVVLARVIA
jgi:23S rRNA (cytosine1962-C5)-methyltransferase